MGSISALFPVTLLSTLSFYGAYNDRQKEIFNNTVFASNRPLYEGFTVS